MKEDFKEDFTHPLNLVSYLRIYDNVLSKPIHENIIDISKSPIAKFKKATIHQDTTIGTWNPKVNEEIRSTEHWGLSNLDESKTCQYLCNLFRNVVCTYIRKYMQSISLKNNGFSINNIEFLKYVKGGHYIFHHDDCANNPRTFSCIYFVNDDYEGGELCFSTLGSSANKIPHLTVSPQANSLIIFPSSFLYQHKVNPVIKGERYSIISWLRA